MGRQISHVAPHRFRAWRGTVVVCAALVLLADARPASALDSALLRGEHFLRRGMRAMERGDLVAAEAAFRRARAAAPRLPQPDVLLGRLALQRGHHRDAEAALLNAIRLYRRMAGEAIRESDRRRQMLEQGGEPLLIQEPRAGGLGFATPSWAGGLPVRRQAGAWEREGCNHVTDVRVPAEVYLLLGDARLLDGRPEEAIPAYRDALREDRRLAVAHHHLALALQAAGRPQEALVASRRAERLGLAGATGLRRRLETDLAQQAKIDGVPTARASAP